MEKINLAEKFNNQKINYSNNNNPSKQKENKPLHFQHKKENLIIAGIGALALFGIVSIAIYKKGISLDKIKFDPNGTALKNGKKFSGTVKDTLSNGDKIKLRYKKGELKSSQRAGIKNITKKYETINGEKIVTTTSENTTNTANINQLKHRGKIKNEALIRIESEKTAQIKAQNAQEYYNKPFNEALSNKSAKESAQIIDEELKIKEHFEATQRANLELLARIKAQNAQEYYNKPFNEALSNKSAKESATNIEVLQRTKMEQQARIKAQNSQNYYDKPFNEALSNKSAKESAHILCVQNKPNSTITPIFDENGNITSRTIETKNGIATREFIHNDEVIERITSYPDGKTISTSYVDGTKIIDSRNDSGNKYGYKIYTKEKGKLKPAGRETVNLEKDYRKTVEYLDDDISKTKIYQNGEEKIILRDKKGNIIDEYTNNYYKGSGKGDIGPLDKGAEKIYADWYIHYAKLCEKYGIPMRPCGVEGGAGAHYYELLQMEQGNWERYLQLEEYRSRYDEKARLMQLLRNNNNEDILSLMAGIDNENIKILASLDTSTLNKLIKMFKQKQLAQYEIQRIIHEILEILNQENNFSRQNINEAAETIIKRYSQYHSYTQNSVHVYA